MRGLSNYVKGLLPPRPWLPPTDLLRDAAYRRLWTSVRHQLVRRPRSPCWPCRSRPPSCCMPAPTQMGLLTAMEIVPFVLFSLPAGVWLDRVRKLPVYVAGEVRDRRSRSRACRWPGGPGWLSLPVALRLRLRHRHGLHDRGQRRADRPHAGRARESGWSRRTRRTRWPARAPRSPGRALAGALIKSRRRAARVAGRCGHAARRSRQRSCAASRSRKRRRGSAAAAQRRSSGAT